MVFKSSYSVKYTKRLCLSFKDCDSDGSGGGDNGRISDGSFNNDDVNRLCRNPFSQFLPHRFIYHLCVVFCVSYTFAMYIYVSVWKIVCLFYTTIQTMLLEFFTLLLLWWWWWLLFGYVNLIDCWRILLHLSFSIFLLSIRTHTHFNGIPPQVCLLQCAFIQTTLRHGKCCICYKNLTLTIVIVNKDEQRSFSRKIRKNGA